MYGEHTSIEMKSHYMYVWNLDTMKIVLNVYSSKNCTLDVFSFVKSDYEIVDSSSFLKRCDECVSRKTKLEVCCIIIFCIRICLRLINQRERFIAITQT